MSLSRIRSRLLYFLLSTFCFLLLSRSVSAATYASAVAAYTAGSLPAGYTSYDDPSVALGPPAPITGVSEGYPNVLSPFSPAWTSDQIVLIGSGGNLTLQFPVPVIASTGLSVGVISNVGIADIAYPDGLASPSPVATLEPAGTAIVSVSENGVNYFTLNGGNPIAFDMPANYFTNAGPYDAAAPSSPEYENFGQPFTGSLDSFANETDAEIISTLNGSGGGTWLDLSAAGLSEVNYINFAVPSADTGDYLAVESVVIADGREGFDPVPLPPAAGTALALLGIILAIRLARRAPPA